MPVTAAGGRHRHFTVCWSYITHSSSHTMVAYVTAGTDCQQDETGKLSKTLEAIFRDLLGRWGARLHVIIADAG